MQGFGQGAWAFLLGLAYGVLSGSCTFGFITPILAIITIEFLFILLFGIGHCTPIAVAGSDAALVRRVSENSRFHKGGQWFRRTAGLAIAGLGDILSFNHLSEAFDLKNGTNSMVDDPFSSFRD